MSEPSKAAQCPKCGTDMPVLLFMGTMPDGWVCPKCKLWFNEKDGKPAPQPLAVII